MERIEHDLNQGEDNWHIFRLDHFGASELVFALGLSKKETRTGLLHAKKTGIAREFSKWLQENVLDRGHELEALARPIIARLIGKKLYPSTYSIGKISASVDGLTADGTTAWEHKQYNKEYFDMVAAGEVPEEHMPQCQQVLMVTGAEKLIFTISDGTQENMVSTEVLPCPEWFEKIRATWAQFEIDLKNYVPVQIAEKPIADAITDLPALFVQAKGEITAHNMEAFGESLKISLANTRALVLITDQDYSNAEAAAKLYRETCKKLVLVKEAVLAQATTIGEATRMIDAWHEDLRVTALKLEKDVTEKKEAQKLAIITQARMAYIEHVTTLELEIKPIRLTLDAPEFAAALKGKRLISAWHDAVNTLLANSKIKADAQARDIDTKLHWYGELSADYEFLFKDLKDLIFKPMEDFQLSVTTRIEAHKAAESARLDAERKQMRIEEEAKAKAKIEADLEADREHQRKQQAIYLAKAKDEEEKAKRIQDDLDAARAHQKKHQALYDEEIAKENPVVTVGAIAPQVIADRIVTTLDLDIERVIISKDEYDSLKKDSEFLDCLRACGVDNWEGWDDAIDMLHEDEDVEQAA